MNKKIILYTPSLYPGGVLESNRLLAKGFSEKGYEIIIVANKETKHNIEGFKHFYLNAGDINRPFKLRNIIEKENPSAVFSNMLPQNISLSIAKYLSKKNKNVKFFGFVRNAGNQNVFSKIYHKPYKWFVKKFYENFDYIIAVSSVVKLDLIKTFSIKKDKIKVIHNPLDLDLINKLKDEPIPKEEEKIFKKKTIIFVGRFHRQKRPDLTLQVIKKVLNHYDVNLLMIGYGEEENSLKKLVKDLNVEKNVYFLPFSRNPFKYINRSYLLILTSEDEGFGRVVAESLACETPVVAFYNEHSGHLDIIKNKKNGFLVPFGHQDKMANTILRLLKNEKLYKKIKLNTQKSTENFSLNSIIDELEKLINT